MAAAAGPGSVPRRWAGRRPLATRIVLAPDQDEVPDHDYRLIEEVGHGGMGVVWKARQAALEREVALKRIRSWNEADVESEAEFLAEATITGALDHPAIVPIHEVARDQRGEPFYTMPLVVGESWSESMLFLTEEENLAVFDRVCDAIAFAHAHDVLYLDLKPENVLLGPFGLVLVVDWGMAGFASRLACMPIQDKARGTPAYMAPEQVLGDPRRLSIRTDVYQLGGILHQLVTGTPPHPGRDFANTLVACRDNVLTDPDHPGALAAIARRALATLPAERHRDVIALQAAVRSYREERVSQSLAMIGQRTLVRARSSRADEDFSAAISQFQAALARWPGNGSAHAGLAEARHAYAEAAAQRGDLGMALRLARSSATPASEVLARRVETLRLHRHRRNRVMRVAQWAVGLAVGFGCLGLAVGLLLLRDAHRVFAAATRERIDAEAKLAEDEHRLGTGGQWLPVLSALFDAPGIEPAIALPPGQWRQSDHALFAEGPQGGTLALRSPPTDARLLCDVIGPGELEIVWPAAAAGGTDPGRLTFRIGDGAVQAWLEGGTPLTHARPPAVQGVALHLAIERIGRVSRLYLNGALCGELVGEASRMAPVPAVEIRLRAKAGTAIDNLRLDRLVPAMNLGAPTTG